jgi:hypothetical protein
MAATTKQAAGAGFRELRVYELNQYGIPLSSSMPASAADPYDGLDASIAKALTITVPDPQIIQHTGDDRVAAVDMLPPTEAITAEMRTGHTNLELDALLQNVNVVALGEMQMMGRGTDQQGLEPDLCILAYRQAVRTGATLAGARCYIQAMMPKAAVFPKAGPMEEQAVDENSYTVNPRICTEYPWGSAFVLGTEGYVSSQLLHGISDKRPHLCVFEGDAAEVNFDFSAAFQGAHVDKIKVYLWVLSTQITTDVTATVTAITTASIDFTAPGAPLAGDIVIVSYEIAD